MHIRQPHVFWMICLLVPLTLHAAPGNGSACAGLPSHAELRTALADANATVIGFGVPGASFGLEMWGTIVNRDGIVCAVAFTGQDRGDQWPGSRAISAQKANTANAFSLPGLALSTANLWAAVQPGGSLYGLQHSNPVDTSVVYGGNSMHNGQPNDPMMGRKVGGVNVFGGGLALYNEAGELLGALGVSGDTSCADHFISWYTRHNLGLDYVPGGVSGDAARPDNIVFDLADDAGGNPESAGGFGHPHCLSAGTEDGVAAGLPSVSVP
jgi:uncharacterized protein GlcG (DUF336 family)